MNFLTDKEDSTVSSEVQDVEEQQVEMSLRPQSLDQYLGQKRVKKEMAVYIKT